MGFSNSFVIGNPIVDLSPLYWTGETLHLNGNMASTDIATKSSGGELFETGSYDDPLTEMSVAQEHVALLMEIAYLALKDHPVVAKEVRLSANMSRTQHMMTLGLMKTFVVTSSTILKTMIPLIKAAVKMKKSTILKPMFLKVLKFSEEMRDEAVKTRESYFQLQAKIQKDTADVNIANAETEKRLKELAEETRKEEERRRLAQEHFKKMESEKQNADEEIKKLKAQRDELLKKSVPDGKNDVCKEFMSGILNPGVLGADVTGKTTAVKGVFGIIGIVVSTIKDAIEGDRAIKASEQVHKFMQQTAEEKSQIENRMDKAEKEEFEARHKVNELALAKANLGDLESLIEASEQLAKIDSQLVNIISFWDNLAAFIKSMNQKGEAGECFLEAIEDETCAEMFNQELEGVEKGWDHFGSICRKYVERATVTVPRVYGFLSEPVDKLGIEERRARTKRLIGELQYRGDVKAIDSRKE